MKDWIYIACKGDDQLPKFFDPAFTILDPEEAAEVIYQKIVDNYPGATTRPLVYEDQIVGYYAWMPGLLISFGVNIHYREKKILQELWKMITDTVGQEFSCVLYTKNSRAISWLRKCGMNVAGENLTILIHAKKENVCQSVESAH